MFEILLIMLKNTTCLRLFFSLTDQDFIETLTELNEKVYLGSSLYNRLSKRQRKVNLLKGGSKF